jgi:hypothetical protein
VPGQAYAGFIKAVGDVDILVNNWVIEIDTVEDAIKLAKAFKGQPERSFSQTDGHQRPTRKKRAE